MNAVAGPRHGDTPGKINNSCQTRAVWLSAKLSRRSSAYLRGAGMARFSLGDQSLQQIQDISTRHHRYDPRATQRDTNPQNQRRSEPTTGRHDPVDWGIPRGLGMSAGAPPSPHMG